MNVVVDASVLVAALADPGPTGRWAEAVVAAGSLAAPHLVMVEATNVLRRLEHAQSLSRPEAAAAQRDLSNLAIELFDFAPFSERIWDLRASVTSYDAWYVAVAEALDVPLATLDRRLSRAMGPRCRFALPG